MGAAHKDLMGHPVLKSPLPRPTIQNGFGVVFVKVLGGTGHQKCDVGSSRARKWDYLPEIRRGSGVLLVAFLEFGTAEKR